MWTLEWTDEFRRRYKCYEKDNPKELRAVLDNLDTYVLSIQAGAPPLVRAFGFIHAEPMGVVAITPAQKFRNFQARRASEGFGGPGGNPRWRVGLGKPQVRILRAEVISTRRATARRSPRRGSYVYPDPKTKVLYAVTLGDKRSQRADLQFCREFVASVREEEGGSNEQEEPAP